MLFIWRFNQKSLLPLVNDMRRTVVYKYGRTRGCIENTNGVWDIREFGDRKNNYITTSNADIVTLLITGNNDGYSHQCFDKDGYELKLGLFGGVKCLK